MSPRVRLFIQIRGELSVAGDIVLRGDHQIIVPIQLRDDYLARAHAAHDGVVRTKQYLRILALWPGMDQDVERLVLNYQHCRTSNKSLFNRARPSPMRLFESPDEPWEKVALAIVGPINSAPPVYHYAINLIDCHSRCVEVDLTAAVLTADVIMFLERVWSREGFPGEWVSDNGRQLVS